MTIRDIVKKKNGQKSPRNCSVNKSADLVSIYKKSINFMTKTKTPIDKERFYHSK